MVDASRLTSPVLPAEIARRFRGSVLFVPALLHRLGEAVIEGIGGCNLGSRNLDFHYRGLRPARRDRDEGESVIQDHRPTASAARTCTWTRRRTPAPRT